METIESRRCVCLFSNCSLDHFPGNSRTSFANLFATPISNTNNSTFFVRLRGLGMAVNPLMHPRWINTVRYIKVQLSEVEEQISGFKRFNRSLGGLNYPPQRGKDGDLIHRRDFFFRSFQNTPFLPLSFSILRQLRVTLTDENDQHFFLDYGAPTTVWLEILTEEEMRDETNFTITCYSFQPEIFANNTLSRFTCPLPESMELKSYEVALAGVIFPFKMREVCSAYLSIENRTFEFDIFKFRTGEDFLAYVNHELEKDPKGKEFKFIKWSAREAYTGQPSWHTVLQRVQNPPDQEQKDMVRVSLSWNFSLVVGDVQHSANVLMVKPGEKIHFGHSGQVANLDRALPNPLALLMCDIVTDSWVGSDRKPLLACLPIKNDAWVQHKLKGVYSWGKYKGITWSYEPEHLHYVDVKSLPFHSISFEFTNMAMNNIQEKTFLPYGRDDTMIVSLIFRPKKQ